MNTFFRFRAECEVDVDIFRHLLKRKVLLHVYICHDIPDVEVILYTDYTYDQLLEFMRHDEDWHVMRQTLAHWNKYTGERDLSID
jgi:hypothetical protein